MGANLLLIFLQNNLMVEENYFNLLMRGGWILLPIFVLFFLSIVIIIERWLVIRESEGKDDFWLSRVIELLKENKTEKAMIYCSELKNSSAKVIDAGLEEVDNELNEIQETMQVEARQEISRLEKGLNYLGITAAIAPMLGFLGTIFGVIKIFYNISVTNDLSISSISDGLYQKMICSGVGLFVGIIAYSGYYILNGKIDRLVNRMEKDTNAIIKCIRGIRRVDDEN